MKRSTTSFVFFTFLLAPPTALADWLEVGAAVQCDAEAAVFSLVPVAKTSDERYDTPAPNGFTEIGVGSDQSFKCDLDGAAIELVISVYGPQERGMGQGSGVITVSRLVAGGRELIGPSTNFNWQVLDERVLSRVTITKRKNQLVSELCYSDGWDWASAYANMKCDASTHPTNTDGR